MYFSWLRLDIIFSLKMWTLTKQIIGQQKENEHLPKSWIFVKKYLKHTID